MSKHCDYMVRATAAEGQIRAFAVTSRDTVEMARAVHNTSPVATAALGRLLSGGVMMGAMMKGERDVLTLRIRGDGPLEGILVTADSQGNVKGYVGNPGAILPANARGKLDVGGVVGAGTLNVVKDLGLKEPYAGQIELQTGEIGDDLTYYFAISEQTPSTVGLGVLMNRDNTVRRAGGWIIQLMPGAADEVIDRLEEHLRGVTSVTELLDRGMTPEDLLEFLLGDLGLEINDTLPVRFYCNCDRARMEKALMSVGREELEDMIREGKPVELNCQFCSSHYTFTIEELKEIRRNV